MLSVQLPSLNRYLVSFLPSNTPTMRPIACSSLRSFSPSVAPFVSIPASRMYRCIVFRSFHPQIFISTVGATPSLMSCVAKQLRRVWNFTSFMPAPLQKVLRAFACLPSFHALNLGRTNSLFETTFISRSSASS